MARNQIAQIDVERCTGCGACVNACPVGAIMLMDDRAHVDEETCTGCGACVEVCPQEAIRLEVVPIPVVEGELVQVKEPRALSRRDIRAPAAQRARPLVETAAPALAVAGAGLLAKATRFLARAVGNWLTKPSEQRKAMGNQTNRAPMQPRRGRSNGRGRQMRRRRRGR